MTSNLLAAIPEHVTRFVQLPNEKGHNAVWDFVRSPDDRFYVSVCGENEKPLTALLYEYYPITGELRLIVDVEKAWIVDAEQMPPSKIHTSIDFLPDGRLIMATHNTAPAPGHKQWMFEQYYEHPWEGYPGSILMIVNPDTNEVEIKGIPVPRESIYGGMLGNNPRFYYFMGYMRGHLYRLELHTNEVKDYGKVSEFSSCRLLKDDKGRFYGSSYTGGIWRFDPETETVTDLKVNFHSPHGHRHRRQFIFGLHSPRGSMFMVDNMDGEMIEIHTETLEVTRHGHIHLPEQPPVEPYGIGGLAADDQFILYYGLKTNDGYSPIRLVRWDILNDGKPENLGLITPNGKDSQYICEMIFDREGWLHMVDVCGEFSPYILAVDMKKLLPPGPDAPSAPLRPYYEPSYNGVGVPAYMHIVAKKTRTLPLHQHMDWRDTAVSHVQASNGKVYCISGQDRVLLSESDYADGGSPHITTVYSNGAPVSCIDMKNRSVAVLTSDGHILIVDLLSGSCTNCMRLPAEIELVKLLIHLESGEILASSQDKALHLLEWMDSSGECHLRTLNNIALQTTDSYPIPLKDRTLLLSGCNDDILLYDLDTMCTEQLEVKSSSLRGRSFKAMITGGAVLADGTVVAGTYDGMLFTLSPDLRRRCSYGRLYSSGQLRNFIKLNDHEVVGVYGGIRDAGHIFHYERDSGFVDLGRPRVVKDNNELSTINAEWANIHFISCIAYSPGDDSLHIASGEAYGSVVRFTGVRVQGAGPN
ncbi:hypothetical protein ACFQZR_04295 [Paenibacillus sp. GCM10027629]|uniref:hypothetical protein n=1 Tax=Paenibacillus sp. GCM10027629 TaxID=3273414 RepID=UPI00363BE2C2